MSTIERMSIQGIRSFGPEENDKQLIQFFAPLTLILGPNGTGKTTIIECLKYMTTGVLPPGCKTSGGFIHDPKVAHEREVKGQIRLQYRDISRKQVQVIRNLTATQKAKKVEMKTLEGVVTRLNAAGEKTSINSKCADLDREMITSLGVSKPVLENVIFCHQEDANWPLSEGKQLKEKFDAIFASTRYVKALDSIRKTKKEQDDKLKHYKTEIGYLKQNRDKSRQLEADLVEEEGKLAACKESVEKVSNNMKPLEEKMDKILRQAEEIYRIQNDITKWTSERKQIEKHAAELQDQLENEFQGTDEELKIVLAEFQDKLEERQKKLVEYERKNKDLDRQMEKLDQEKSRVLVEVGRLEQEAEKHEQNVSKRDNLIKQYAEEYSFQGLHGSITDEKYKTFLKCMQEKLVTMKTTAMEKKGEYEEEERAVQKKIDDLRKSQTMLEQNERNKRELMEENKRKVKEANRKLSEIEASGGRLDQLTRDLKRQEAELESQEKNVSTDKMRQEIDALARDKRDLESTISQLDSEMHQIHLQSSAQAELDMFKKDKASKEESIRRTQAKIEDMVRDLLGHMPKDNIRAELEEYIMKQSEEVRRSSDEVSKANRQMSESETKRKMYGDQLKKKENELKGLEERVYSVCGSQNYDEGLTTVQEKLEKARDERGTWQGAECFFKKYTLDLGKDDPCCPLCLRRFDTSQEVRELIQELNKKLLKVPGKLKKAEEEIDQYQEKYDEIMQLKPLKETITSLENEDIPGLRTSLRKCQEETQKLKEKVTDLEEQLEVKDNYSQMAKEIQPDVVMMDKYYGEIADLEQKIKTQTAKLEGAGSGRTLQQVVDEKRDVQVKIDTMARELDRKRQKLTDHQDNVQLLRATINSLREEKLRIDNDMQQKNKLEDDKTTWLAENETHERDIRESREKLRPIQGKIDSQIDVKERLTRQKDEAYERAKAEIEMVKNHATKVKDIHKEIKDYNMSGKADNLQKGRDRKVDIEDRVDQLDSQQKDCAANIDKLRKDLSTQTIREHDLQNNLALRSRQKEVVVIAANIAQAEEKLGGLDATSLGREEQKLKRELEKLTKERHTAEGRQEGLEGQIRSLKRELQSDMYKGASEKYRNKMIDLKTTELANGDLNKYYMAMDKAINNFHQLRMEEINKIIRELWRNTYRGNDIETIEIRSEDDGSAITNRKTYNYRVVMIKPGDVVIDMRNRCSAGQKVLASLIIRLALAETFCLNCGILALDEPTTNLDRENIESLASALVDIIKGRIHQKNFQLVVITHDEDFVELLGRSDYVDYFYRVGKASSNGCSRIKKSDVRDLRT